MAWHGHGMAENIQRGQCSHKGALHAEQPTPSLQRCCVPDVTQPQQSTATHVQEVRAALTKHAAGGESDVSAGILLDEDLEPDQDHQNRSSGRVIDLTDDVPEAAKGVKQEGPSGDPHSADNLADQSRSAHDLFTSSIRTQPSKASRYLDALDRWSPHPANLPCDVCLRLPMMQQH